MGTVVRPAPLLPGFAEDAVTVQAEQIELSRRAN